MRLCALHITLLKLRKNPKIAISITGIPYSSQKVENKYDYHHDMLAFNVRGIQTKCQMIQYNKQCYNHLDQLCVSNYPYVI